MNRVPIRCLWLWLLFASGCDDSVVTVDTGPEPGTVLATGYLESAEVASIVVPDVYRTYNFKISFMVPEGTDVTAGQPILSFEPTNVRDNLIRVTNLLEQEKQKIANTRLQSEARLEQLRLSLAEKKADVEKAQLLYNGAKVSEGRIVAEQRRLELAIANDEVLKLQRSIEKQQQTVATNIGKLADQAAQYEYQVEQYRAGLEKFNVTAPKSGMIVYQPLFDGRKLTVGDTVFLGQPLIDIPTLDKMVVVGQINEFDISKVEVGQRVEVVLDTVPDRTFQGSITSLGTTLRPKSETQPSVIMDARITLDTPDPRIMRPGMTARLGILTGTNHGA
jgi:HlyD family secretion protein